MPSGRVAVDEERSRAEESVGAPQPDDAGTGFDGVEGDARVTVIRPASRRPHLDLGELWHYRELLFRLTWRDVAVRYKQTSVGILWAILQPVLQMIVFTLIFGKFAKFPTYGVPYQIFIYSGLLPWNYFASSVSVGGASIVTNRAMVTKVYFPRVLLPLAGVTVPIADFLFASTVVFGLMVWFSIWPNWAIVLAPIFMLMAGVTALGVGLFLAAVAVRYRDVPYAIPFVIQIWMFVSGVFGAISRLPEKWQWLLSLNPMTSAISGFRWGLIGTPPPELGKLAISVAMTVVFLVGGLWYFRRSEPRFADTV